MELIEKFIFFFVLLNSDDAYLFKMRPFKVFKFHLDLVRMKMREWFFSNMLAVAAGNHQGLSYEKSMFLGQD
jgi:hypothetical protein